MPPESTALAGVAGAGILYGAFRDYQNRQDYLKQQSYNNAFTREQFEYQKKFDARQLDYQKNRLSYTMQDAMNAGIHPTVAMGVGPANAPAAGPAPTPPGAGSAGNSFRGEANILQAAMMSAQIRNLDAQTKNLNAQADQTSLKTQQMPQELVNSINDISNRMKHADAHMVQALAQQLQSEISYRLSDQQVPLLAEQVTKVFAEREHIETDKRKIEQQIQHYIDHGTYPNLEDTSYAALKDIFSDSSLDPLAKLTRFFLLILKK